MYESKDQPLLPARHFRRRMLKHISYAFLLMLLTLFVGAAGYVILEEVHWHDAFLNTALIVGGIGPYIFPKTALGKLFFAAYGLVVGLVFVTTLGIILAPLAHRLIHRFHLDDEGDDDSSSASANA